MNKRMNSLLACVALGVVLTGCYVVPIQDGSRVVQTSNLPSSSSTAVMPSSTLNAKLYPTNAEAQRYGTVFATVNINQTGHGTFSANIGGENFNGDATHYANSRKGKANGAGVGGRYISCDYEMNTPQQGMGQCRMSTGATFSMHIN